MPAIPTTALVSTLSRQWLSVPIGLYVFTGDPVNPTADEFPADMAFVQVAAAPGSSDWHPANYVWDDHRWAMRCLIGPSGGVVLPAGLYDVWIRLVRDTEQIIAPAAGRLRIF
jgi:hypothetical protein